MKIWDLLSESKRIIHAQSRLYLNLSLIFLLPLSFLSLISQLLLKHFQQQQPINHTLIITFSIISILISYIFTSCAIISITYSVYHSFFNRPVKLKEAIKSIFTSFFPLLATSVVIFAVFFFISFVLLILVGLVLFLTVFLGPADLTTNPSFVILCFMVLMIVYLPLTMYLTVNLCLVKAIVVVESCWGFEPLRRSWKLVKGTKMLILSTMFLFVPLQMILVWISGYSWILILVISPLLAILSLYSIAVLSVLYIYCKEKNGELAEDGFEKEKDEASLPLI